MENQAAFLKRQEKAKHHIKVGSVLLIIGSILFFIDAAFELAEMIYGPLLNQVNWNQFSDTFQYFTRLFIIPFMILSGIGGISYVKKKGPFISFVALMAIIVAFLFVMDLIQSIITLINNKNWLLFSIELVSVQFDGGLYFLGWFLSKDDFE